MTEYTPPGRPSAWTLPATTDSADLIAILQAFADDTMNAAGDTVTGDYTITGTVDMSDPQKGGVALITGADVGVLKVCTSGTRPGSPGVGQMIYETDTLKTLQWDGAGWASVSGSGSAGWDTIFLTMGA